MTEKNKNKIVCIIFFCFIFGIFFINLIVKDKDISESERRKLAQFPKISWSNIWNGSFFKQFENYTTDQIVAREVFRKIKVISDLELLKKKDNNGLYIKDGYIFKTEYPIKESSIKNWAEKCNEIVKKYIKEESNIYYSIIPDKNYFINDKETLKIDYKKMEQSATSKIDERMQYIPIFDLLTLEDYYKTDTHWKQENLDKVVKRISEYMQIEDRVQTGYIKKDIGDFYGVYYGQLGIDTDPDTIYYLTNNVIESCSVYNYETNQTTKIYDLSKIKAQDKYDFFLSGATPLLKIENPNCKTDEELIIFRDSFGSSIIPLIVEAYKTITVVDTRYISSSILEQYITFEKQDVLFLYSTLILNNSSTLK